MFPNSGYLRLWYSDPSWDLDKVIQFRVTWFAIFKSRGIWFAIWWFLGYFDATLWQLWAQLAMLWILTLSNLNSRLLGSMAGFELWLDFRWSDFWYNLNIRLRLGSRFWHSLNIRLWHNLNTRLRLGSRASRWSEYWFEYLRLQVLRADFQCCRKMFCKLNNSEQ